jgi:predicted Zn-dependent protease
MMRRSLLKYIFFTASAALLFLMLIASRDAGINCDEPLHYNQSVAVYKYFATRGEDRSALNTPVTLLKYYGQSYDNLVTVLIEWSGIENIYGFRHFMSSIAGWLAIMITALFAVWLTGYRTGILVIILFAVSPTFLGHSQNNLKDIPFALGYIWAIYYMCKFITGGPTPPVADTIFLTAGIAFSVSIRAGGLLLLCYACLFIFLFYLYRYFNKEPVTAAEIAKKLFMLAAISLVSVILGILLWPYALQSPVKNVLESYRVMAHFPDTFMQIFRGRLEWSDFMPWYYLPLSMIITIPVVVLGGFLSFFIFAKSLLRDKKLLIYGFIVFTIIFPVVFVIIERSNLYSSWRQFLFLYPGIVLIAASGINFLFDYFKNRRYLKWGLVLLIALLSVHPLKFIVKNTPYSYLYYNQLVGGLAGAYGNFETDYYYVSQTEASHWLLDYLKEKKISDTIKIKATYPVTWLFRHHPEIKTSYFRYSERSQSDWDYAIVANRYITPYQLKNKIWPPANAIHIVYADQMPVCAVLKRESKYDLCGYNAFNEGETAEAVKFYEKALRSDSSDEMIFYNFARALYREGQSRRADSVLKEGLEINPVFEPILMYLGNIARSQGRKDEAVMYYSRVIEADRKYFEAYVGKAELLSPENKKEARVLLRRCLEMNPGYKPAFKALADTYRNSDPEIARKYDAMANGKN